MKSEVKATSFCEPTELLFEGTRDKSLKHFCSPFAFRELSPAVYPLKTSLMRLRGCYGKVGGHLIRNLAKHAYRSAESVDSVWHTLAIVQAALAFRPRACGNRRCTAIQPRATSL